MFPFNTHPAIFKNLKIFWKFQVVLNENIGEKRINKNKTSTINLYQKYLKIYVISCQNQYPVGFSSNLGREKLFISLLLTAHIC